MFQMSKHNGAPAAQAETKEGASEAPRGPGMGPISPRGRVARSENGDIGHAVKIGIIRGHE